MLFIDLFFLLFIIANFVAACSIESFNLSFPLVCFWLFIQYFNNSMISFVFLFGFIFLFVFQAFFIRCFYGMFVFVYVFAKSSNPFIELYAYFNLYFPFALFLMITLQFLN